MIAPLLIRALASSFMTIRELTIVPGLECNEDFAIFALMVWGAAMIAISALYELVFGLEASMGWSLCPRARRLRSRSIAFAFTFTITASVTT